MIPLRDENPRGRFPLVALALIAANAYFFYREMLLGSKLDAFIFQYGMLPLEIVRGENLRGSSAIAPYWTLLTSMFLHAGLWHLLGNMWFLWIFGDNVEEALGRFRFLLFYLFTGAAAGLVHVFMNPMSTVPTLGASGAISGVLGAYLVLFPGVRIRTLVPIFIFLQVFRIPAVVFLGLWFVLQALGGLGPGSEGAGVAFGAHIGGFVAGAAIALVVRLRRYPPGSPGR